MLLDPSVSAKIASYFKGLDLLGYTTIGHNHWKPLETCGHNHCWRLCSAQPWETVGHRQKPMASLMPPWVAVKSTRQFLWLSSATKKAMPHRIAIAALWHSCWRWMWTSPNPAGKPSCPSRPVPETIGPGGWDAMPRCCFTVTGELVEIWFWVITEA